MAGPATRSDDDPGLAELRTICPALPGAKETTSHAGPKWRPGRVFAVFGGFKRLSSGEQLRVPSALVFTPDPVDLPAIDEDDRFFVPAYYGPPPGLVARLDARRR